MNNKIIIAYIPVIHKGYIEFLKRHSGKNSKLWLIDSPPVFSELDYIKKEIRALPSLDVKEIIEKLEITFSGIFILNKKMLELFLLQINQIVSGGEEKTKIIMPDDDLSHMLRDILNIEVVFDPVFLRWDRKNTTEQFEVLSDEVIESSLFLEDIVTHGDVEKSRASDWWRQVGAVLFSNDKIIVSTHNTHLPTEYTPYINGDPRNAFQKGVHIDLGTSIHAEAGLIAWAAKNGVSVNGLNMYISTFPCPTCAKLIAMSGIKNVYFSEGYGILDAVNILKTSGVKIINIKQ